MPDIRKSLNEEDNRTTFPKDTTNIRKRQRSASPNETAAQRGKREIAIREHFYQKEHQLEQERQLKQQLETETDPQRQLNDIWNHTQPQIYEQIMEALKHPRWRPPDPKIKLLERHKNFLDNNQALRQQLEDRKNVEITRILDANPEPLIVPAEEIIRQWMIF
jgi:hypothetical protein